MTRHPSSHPRNDLIVCPPTAEPGEKNDQAWLDEGVRLLAAVRVELGEGYDVVVTEPWWGETPNA